MIFLIFIKQEATHGVYILAGLAVQRERIEGLAVRV